MSQDLALQDGAGDLPASRHGDSSPLGTDLLLLHLSWIENSLVAWVLDELFPPDKVKRWIYSPLSLLKLALLQDKKRISYRALVSTLTAEECFAIGLKEIAPGQFRIPCASTVHDFVRLPAGRQATVSPQRGLKPLCLLLERWLAKRFKMQQESWILHLFQLQYMIRSQSLTYIMVRKCTNSTFFLPAGRQALWTISIGSDFFGWL